MAVIDRIAAPRNDAISASGKREKVDPVSMLASGRDRSQRVSRAIVLLAIGLDDEHQETVGALGNRYEVRFVDAAADVTEEMAHRLPDVLIVDDDDDDDAHYDLLARLAGALTAPVVVVLSGRDSRPSLARHFGVPGLRKPASAEQVQSAIDVALEQNLRPVPRRMGE